MLESPGHPELGGVLGAEGLSLHKSPPCTPRVWDPAGKKYPSASNTEPWQCKPAREGGEASLAAINGFHSYRWKAGKSSRAGGGTKMGEKGENHHPCPDMAKGTRRWERR